MMIVFLLPCNLVFNSMMFPIMNFVEISLPINFDNVHAQISIFDKINHRPISLN